MEKVYTATATSIGGRSGNIKSSDGVLDLNVRPPKQMGGPDGAYTNPEQLFAAGYAACFGSALGHIALEKMKVRLSPVITANVSLYKKDNGYQLGVELDIVVPNVSQQEAEELAHAAHQFCPYSIATRNNIEVNLKVRTE